ncbi:hypothetical protein SAMN02745170_01420 [Propionispora hippei DSM 15287]|uniref:Uncharacterized protein n=1 Tax=Propionispora hippei DSM 15287 TaxID=1123003 RepID=A0A1M6FFG7_9FIRM|nr:hypothetical protein SAMN02745170_01420 [Propionispora hippei DSM 15287]
MEKIRYNLIKPMKMRDKRFWAGINILAFFFDTYIEENLVPCVSQSSLNDQGIGKCEVR